MYPSSYVDYLVHFHSDRDYFECHELLEEYWKSLPQEGKTSTWVGLIQIAVAQYHHRRNNFTGAQKMLDSAIRILAAEERMEELLGLEKPTLMQLLNERQEMLVQKASYVSFNLPIVDAALLDRCQQLCAERALPFGTPSNLSDDSICHKHLRRDRSDVVAARSQELARKTAARSKKSTS